MAAKNLEYGHVRLIIERKESDMLIPSAFDDLRRGSIAMGQALSVSLRRSRRTVALLCPSSIDFLFAWLGLMRMGHSVLLIAYVPQCVFVLKQYRG